MKIDINKIVISESFFNSKPSDIKVKKYREDYYLTHKQKKPIVLNEDYVLIDGYIQYLILKENGVMNAYCKIYSNYKNSLTTYVYGTHKYLNCERVWRVPPFKEKEFSNLQVGESVWCKTKYGIAPVTITKIEKLNKPPVDFDIKTVVRKCNVSKGCSK